MAGRIGSSGSSCRIDLISASSTAAGRRVVRGRRRHGAPTSGGRRRCRRVVTASSISTAITGRHQGRLRGWWEPTTPPCFAASSPGCLPYSTIFRWSPTTPLLLPLLPASVCTEGITVVAVLSVTKGALPCDRDPPLFICTG